MRLEGMNLGRAIIQLGLDPDSGVTISSTPFGTGRQEPNQAFAKSSVPWAGISGMDELEKINPKVASGLKSAQSKVKSKKGTKGTTYYNGKYMPKIAAELAKEA